MDDVFHRAASKALLEWDTDLTETELVQEIWVWYLASLKIQETMDGLPEGAQIRYARRAALQILSRSALDADMFQGQALYSSDSVREALKGESGNKYLREILPIATDTLARKNPDHAEAIRVRYDDGVVPEQGSDNALLVRAVKSLTEEINVLYLTLNDNEVRAGRPDARRSKGQYSDPTANIALMLIDHPEMRDDYLEVTPIEDLLKGCNANDIRLTSQRHGEVGVLPIPGNSRTLPPRKINDAGELASSG